MDKLAGKAGIFAPSIYCTIMQAVANENALAVALAGLKKKKKHKTNGC